MEPTEGDMLRDLRADLRQLRCLEGRQYESWVRDNSDDGWQAAARRAIAAEKECFRLRLENARLREELDAVLRMTAEGCPHAH